MKKRYQVPLLISLLFVPFLGFGQDPAAKKILDDVSAKVKSSRGITADISLKSVSRKGADKGEFGAPAEIMIERATEQR